MTEEAKRMINKEHILRDLRDGGWEKKNSVTKDGDDYHHHDADNNDEMDEDDTSATMDKDIADQQNDVEEDSRIEGTTSYLPPEVVMGARPTLAADTWALGCVMYQCLTGRPPVSYCLFPPSSIVGLAGTWVFCKQPQLTAPFFFPLRYFTHSFYI